MNPRRAFTLVELLVVISVVSMLASIIMVQISLAQASGRDSVRTQQIRQIDVATQMYIQDRKKAPLTGCEVQTTAPTEFPSACVAISTEWVEGDPDNPWQKFRDELSPYIDVPQDPCRGTCQPGNPDFPIGYTYVAPLAMQYYCEYGGGDCVVTDESYQLYAPMERQTVPDGNNGSTDNYITSDGLVGGSGGEDTTPPTVPSNIVAIVSANTVNITWDESTDNVGVAGYRVYLIDNGNALFEYPMNSSSASLIFNTTEVHWNHNLCFVVSAYDAANNSSEMSVEDENSCVTVAPPEPYVSVPDNLQVEFMANGSIRFTWAASVSTYGFPNDSSYTYEIYKQGEEIPKRTIQDNLFATFTGSSAASWGPSFCWTMRAIDFGGHPSDMTALHCVSQ